MRRVLLVLGALLFVVSAGFGCTPEAAGTGRGSGCEDTGATSLCGAEPSGSPAQPRDVPAPSFQARPACGASGVAAHLIAGAGPMRATVRDLALDAAGRELLVGDFEDGLSLGGVALRSAGGRDVFVAGLDPCGRPLWCAQLGGAGEQRSFAIAADRNGAALVLGSFAGTLDLGAGPLRAEPRSKVDLFVAKLDRGGQALWAAQLSGGPDSILTGTDIAVDERGGALVLGKLEGTAVIAGGRLERRALGPYVVKIDATGRFAWGATLPGGSDREDIGIRVDPSGNVVVAGQDARGTATFVTKLDGAGQLLWQKRFGGSSAQVEGAYDVAVDAEGAIVLSGHGVFGEPDLPGGPRAFVAKLGRHGEVIWIKRATAVPKRLAISPRGILMAGPSGCSRHEGVESCAIHLAELDAAGEERWSGRFGKDAAVFGLAVAPAGDAVLVGSFKGTIDFGAGPLSSPRDALFFARVPLPR